MDRSQVEEIAGPPCLHAPPCGKDHHEQARSKCIFVSFGFFWSVFLVRKVVLRSETSPEDRFLTSAAFTFDFLPTYEAEHCLAS